MAGKPDEPRLVGTTRPTDHAACFNSTLESETFINSYPATGQQPGDCFHSLTMRHRYSLIGLIVGFLAVSVAAFENHLVASKPSAEDKRTLRELATEAGKKVLKEKVLKEEPAESPPKPFHPVRITYTLLGLAAMGLGAVSWIKKEHIRMSGGAVALGLVAICWQWVLIGVCIAIVIFILAHLSV